MIPRATPRPRTLRPVLLLAGTLALGGWAQSPLAAQGPASKIDADLRLDQDSVSVLVLAATQPLLGPGGLPDFIAEHRDRPRSELRTRVVQRLKETAAREQAGILAALRGAGPVEPLWVVNAVAARVTPGTVRELARRDDVRFIYGSDLGRERPAKPATVAEVVVPEETPFRRRGRPTAWNLDSLRVPAAWDRGATGAGVVIALLDTGLEYRHPDLRNRVWVNAGETPNNGRDDDGNGYVDDYYGMDLVAGSPEVLAPDRPHGTLVAGILAGDGTGGTITGVAPDARIMTLTTSYLLYSMKALEYALEMGADVANMSFSLPGLGNLRGIWRLAADHATAAGLVMVSGAGNFRQSADPPVELRIPEAIPSVIAVGGVEPSGVRAEFSGGGPVTWEDVRYYGDHPLAVDGLVKPDVVGFPGPGFTWLRPDSTGGYIEGTGGGNSFSGPQAAGIAALILSVAPELPAWTVKEIIEATARDLPPEGKDNATGWGVLDADAAVRAALQRNARDRRRRPRAGAGS